jgi:RNA recognition motif-containing protein
MKARVFVGNVPVAAITKKELEEIFQKYGKIIGKHL